MSNILTDAWILGIQNWILVAIAIITYYKKDYILNLINSYKRPAVNSVEQPSNNSELWYKVEKLESSQERLTKKVENFKPPSLGPLNNEFHEQLKEWDGIKSNIDTKLDRFDKKFSDFKKEIEGSVANKIGSIGLQTIPGLEGKIKGVMDIIDDIDIEGMTEKIDGVDKKVDDKINKKIDSVKNELAEKQKVLVNKLIDEKIDERIKMSKQPITERRLIKRKRGKQKPAPVVDFVE